MHKLNLLLTLALLQLMGLIAHAQLTNGIYAIFDTTLGSFTSEIHYVEAPLAAANFIGLAEGSLPWIDEASGRLTQGPYYDGNTFHRVIDHFVIQGGSPNGLGTDGPGYSFIDEFNPALTHSSTGTLSMANSGPHSNGSQFFITLNPTPHLDSGHVVFGEIVDGLTIVQNIGDVITDCIVLGTNACLSDSECALCPTCIRCFNKPVTNVVMNSVQILRIGAAAQAFNPATNALLPLCSAIAMTGSVVSNNLFITMPGAVDHDLNISLSTNLIDWSTTFSGFASSTGPRTLNLVLDSAREIFTASDVTYPHIVLPNLTQRAVTMNLSGNSFSNIPCQIIRNNASNSFTYTSGFTNNPAGNLGFISPLYSASRPYLADFQPVLVSATNGPHIYLDLKLYFSSSTNGVLEGSYTPDLSTNTFEAVTGTFYVDDL